jgi:integrase
MPAKLPEYLITKRPPRVRDLEPGAELLYLSTPSKLTSTARYTLRDVDVDTTDEKRVRIRRDANGAYRLDLDGVEYQFETKDLERDKKFNLLIPIESISGIGAASEADKEALLPQHQRIALVIGYHLGLRRGEIRQLRWDQVDWLQNVVRLKRRQTKSGQRRLGPLCGELRQYLELAYRGRDSPFIVSYKGHSASEPKRAWNTARQAAGLPGLLFHDLRRTAVRNMVRAGIPEKVAMLISGHKTRSVFERYNIVDERDFQVAGERMTAYLESRRVVTTKVTGESSDPEVQGSKPNDVNEVHGATRRDRTGDLLITNHYWAFCYRLRTAVI